MRRAGGSRGQLKGEQASERVGLPSATLPHPGSPARKSHPPLIAGRRIPVCHEHEDSPEGPRVTPSPVTRVIASPRNWIDGAAVQQLEKTARLPGMRLAVGLPDLHPGKGSPIGAAFLSEGRLHPALVGNDIGCGIGLWGTSLRSDRIRREAWARKLRGLEDAWEGDAAAWLGQRGVEATAHDASLGTIGGGNHFAEIQSFEQVLDEPALREAGLDPGDVLLLVHSGSRGLGEEILADHLRRFGTDGFPDDGEDARAWLARHDHATAWARANRELIAARILGCLGAEGRRVLDVGHNFVESREFDGGAGWLHRKGAAPATEGLVVIPGSRGALSYLVRPRAASERSAWSLAHGAGRKWSRADSRARLEERFSPADLTRTDLGSHVICEDKALLYEEAPQAYKRIDVVISDLAEAGLLDVVALLRPLVTYKVRR